MTSEEFVDEVLTPLVNLGGVADVIEVWEPDLNASFRAEGWIATLTDGTRMRVTVEEIV